MKSIQHITLEIELGDRYQFSLEGTERLHKFIEILLANVNEFICKVLGFDGIQLKEEYEQYKEEQ